MALGIEQRTAPGRGATQEHINSWSLWRMEVPACDSILTLHRDAVNWPYAQSKSSDRNHIALLQAAVTQPSAPAWHTKSRSAWSSIIFQSLHDLKFSSMLLVKLFSQNHFSCLTERFWEHVSSYMMLQSWLFDLCLRELPLFSQGHLNISRNVHHPGASRKVLITYDELAHVLCRKNDQLMDERCESSCFHPSHCFFLLFDTRVLLPQWCGRCRGEGERERMAMGGSGCWWHLLLGYSLSVPAFFHFPTWPSLSIGLAAMLQP